MHHAGDAVLAEVGDTVDALDCAVCVQKRFTRGNFDEAIRNYEIAIYLDDNLTDRLNRKPGLLAEAAVASSPNPSPIRPALACPLNPQRILAP